MTFVNRNLEKFEAEAVDVLDEASQVLDKAHQGQEGAFEYIEQHNKLRVCVS